MKKLFTTLAILAAFAVNSYSATSSFTGQPEGMSWGEFSQAMERHPDQKTSFLNSLVDGANHIIIGTVGQSTACYLELIADVSGGIKITPLAASVYTINVTNAAQTVGATTLTIPDFASVVDEFTFKTKSQTMSNKTFVTPVLGAATGTSVAVTGALTSSGGAAAIGYATGAGGTITQATDRTTTVVLSKTSGQITTEATSLAAGAIVTFTVTNTTVTATDVVAISKVSGDADTHAWVNSVGTGSFTVTLHNTHATDADVTAFVFNAVVINGVSS